MKAAGGAAAAAGVDVDATRGFLAFAYAGSTDVGFSAGFPLPLLVLRCVLAVLLTLTAMVPRNLRNRVEKHWMLLCYLHVGFWVLL